MSRPSPSPTLFPYTTLFRSVTLAQLRDGLADFQPSSDRSPGRLNLFRLGGRIVIVDFAHNEAGVNAVLDVAEGIAGGAAGRTRSEEHTSELQSQFHLVCRLL